LSKKRILFAPLNWGLGHVTRSIPIIGALLHMGHEVILASDGEAKALLADEFPDLECLDLPSYRVEYSSKSMVINFAKQLPSLVWTVQREHAATLQIVKHYSIDGIISDNRYGCFSDKVPSVLMTHQLRILTNNLGAQAIGNQILGLAYWKFNEIWVPDYESTLDNLTGKLSHGRSLSKPLHYIGPLSRMKSYQREREYDVAVVLSGPEPQRSYLESLLMEQALALPMHFVFIQGKPHTNKQFFAADNVEVVSYLTSFALNDVINASKVLVCRSGYSSIMDLVALRKKALLIPTPGQTEQEYLAKKLFDDRVFPVQVQKNIKLEEGVKSISKFTGFDPNDYPLDLYKKRLNLWLESF
jgi:uncharacterized protein (TIGR00661 family)